VAKKLIQKDAEKVPAKKPTSSAYPNRAARKVPTDLAALRHLLSKMQECVKLIDASADAVEDHGWTEIEFDGANQGVRAVELLKKFASNLTKAVTNKKLDE